MAASLSEQWNGGNVTLGEVEAELARLRGEAVEEGGGLFQRTSVMTHVAWVPERWLDAAERTLEGMAERHPSRTVILVPHRESDGDCIDAEVAVRCFAAGDQSVCGEVIELHLHGKRALAPASIVLPLVISDLPVFVRWRGQPWFGDGQWEQLVEVADRVVVDSAEWEELRYRELSEAFSSSVVSDIAWSRTHAWRAKLAVYWPAIREQEIRIRGPRAEATLLRGWLTSRLGRAIRPTEPAEDLGVRLGGEDLPPPHSPRLSPSDLLSAELDRFSRDHVYEAAVAASITGV